MCRYRDCYQRHALQRYIYLLKVSIIAYWPTGIIHGDIKPANVLIFEESSRIVARMADFGFATCFQGDNDLISIPISEPWNAPEHHTRHFRPEQAKRMDVFSFAMLCVWFLFEAGISFDLPLPTNMAGEVGQFVSLERYWPEMNLLQQWKSDCKDKLIDWISWLIYEDLRFDSNMKANLIAFFRSTLSVNPQLRCTDFEYLINLITPNR